MAGGGVRRDGRGRPAPTGSSATRSWARASAWSCGAHRVATRSGWLLDRFLFRAMRTAGWQVKLVVGARLFIALPEIVQDFSAASSRCR